MHELFILGVSQYTDIDKNHDINSYKHSLFTGLHPYFEYNSLSKKIKHKINYIKD